MVQLAVAWLKNQNISVSKKLLIHNGRSMQGRVKVQCNAGLDAGDGAVSRYRVWRHTGPGSRPQWCSHSPPSHTGHWSHAPPRVSSVNTLTVTCHVMMS